MSELLNFAQYKSKICEILSDAGLNESQINIVADYFATVDFYGIKSHGVKTLKAHVDKIVNEQYNINPNFEVIKDFPGCAVIDGDNSIGMVSATKCIDYAMERASTSGVFSVYSYNNNTYGAAFYYALQAAKNGFICFTMSNSPAQMAPYGGKKKMLGTNPFAVGIPGKNSNPLIIDMATSVVAKSKLNEYKNTNQPIPQGWALDCNGQPTTDAQTALEGLMLPMAGFKGYGISLVIDSLAGLLSGAQYLDSVGRFYAINKNSMNVGFNFVIVSPTLIYGENFYSEFDNYIMKLRECPTVSQEEIVIPGDDRIKAFNQNIKNGIEFIY